MRKNGKSVTKPSPVGTGLYLDGSRNTFVKLKSYDENCLAHPSTCDFTIGFFFKFDPKPGMQIYFGNKDADQSLYEGVNIYQNGSFRVMVYGQDKYCSRVIHPPRGIWFYLGLVWDKAGVLTVYIDSWFSHSVPSRDCGESPDGLKTREEYYLGRDTFPIAYYEDLNIWYSKQPESVLDEKWEAAFGKLIF